MDRQELRRIEEIMVTGGEAMSGVGGLRVASVTPVADAPASSDGFTARPRLGDLLVAKGMITEAQLEEALGVSVAQGELLGRVLLRRRWIFEDELARTLAEQLGLPYVDLHRTGVDRALARSMPVQTGLQVAAIPTGFLGDRVRVAFADPLDQSAQQAVTAHFPQYDSVVAQLTDIEQAWRTIDPANADSS